MTNLEFLKKHKFAVIYRHIAPQYTKDATKALFDAGVRIFEITFNPSSKTTIEDTTKIIKDIYEMYGDEVSVGAGTVINMDFAKAAYKAGAKFIVSPCTNKKIVKYTKKVGMLSIPGAYTPTEIMNAYEMGADIVKIFPVTADQIGYLKNVTGPLSHIPFLPTGGINPNTIADFLATGAVAVAAGATIITKDLCEKGDFETIYQNAKNHLDNIK